MIIHYIKSFLFSAKKNRFFYSITLIGFLTGFLLLTIILTYVFQELSFDNFHKNAPDIYRINSGGYGVTPLCFAEKLKNQVPEISGIIRFSIADPDFVYQNKKVNIGKTYYTDPEMFHIFSFKLLLGDAENALKNPFSMVISQATAYKLFENRSAIGETIRDKNGTIFTVTGVMEDIPYNSHIQSNAFLSLETLRHTGNNTAFGCGEWSMLSYVNLIKNSNFKETEIKINAILYDSRMGTHEGKIALKLEPLRKVYFDFQNNKYDGCRHGNLQTVILYLGISILILLIIIINYINLTTAIAGNRLREIAIRKVNGANQSQIILQIMSEALITTLISFILAVLIIEITLPQLSSLLNLPVSVSLNRSVLYVYYFVGVVLVGIISGLIPGIFLSKISVIKALKNQTVSRSRGFQRKTLLVVQLLVVALLLNCSFILKNQINYVLGKELGFNDKNVVSFTLNPTLIGKRDLLKANLIKNPKVENVAFSDAMIGDGFAKASFDLADKQQLCYVYSINPDYLGFYEMKMKYGRNFSPDMVTDFSKSCIINEAAAKLFGNESPINRTTSNRTIIGVVADFNFTSLHNQIEPLVIFCTDSGHVAQVKIFGQNQAETLSQLSKACKDLSPEFEENFTFLEHRIKQLYKSEFDLRRNVGVYSVITFIITLLGLFGLTYFLITKKIREVSLRKLYGASITDIFILLARGHVTMIIISNLLAIPVSWLVMNNWLNNFQYRIEIGFLVFAKTLLFTLVFSLAAISFIIIKTYKIKLIETLKHE
jgi:putative ABC transport system permease protein